jgi:16S rRNA A1518/A1519 N6-dimethyltransferase RsmA/KsgA/DIM1 with predicted DNA glycosylase/AP lyase activity
MFWAIEKDTTFQPILEKLVPQHQLIFNDVLEVDLHSLPIDLDSTLVYGSLPYYITSPIISKVFLPPTNKQEARPS